VARYGKHLKTNCDELNRSYGQICVRLDIRIYRSVISNDQKIYRTKEVLSRGYGSSTSHNDKIYVMSLLGIYQTTASSNKSKVGHIFLFFDYSWHSRFLFFPGHNLL
jgi:hypothetical protein